MSLPRPTGWGSFIDMHEFCHRCGGELSASDGSSPFCPHCGAPQIYLLDHEPAAEIAATDTTGAAPPPAPRQVEWKTAIRCALLVAAVAAVLSAGGGAVRGGLAPELAVDGERLADYAGALSEAASAGVDGCRNRGADRRGGRVCAGESAWRLPWRRAGWWRAMRCTIWPASTPS